MKKHAHVLFVAFVALATLGLLTTMRTGASPNASDHTSYLAYIEHPVHTPTPTSTPSATPTPTSTAIPTNTPIPTPTNTPSPGSSGDVNIRTIFYDGSGPQEPDEYVEIRNDDDIPIQLYHWTLRDIANHVFTFPSFVMQPDQVCRIYTNQWHPEWCNFNYQNGSAIWNNSGDCAYLRNSAGTLIDDYCY